MENTKIQFPKENTSEENTKFLLECSRNGKIEIWNIYANNFLEEQTMLNTGNISLLNLERAELSRANLERAELSRANLERANLFGANLFRATMAGAVLKEANLEMAILVGANLEGTTLSSAKLRAANLERAILIEANLARTDLRRTDLRRTALEKANLSGADLTGADLERTDLTGADLTGAIFDNPNNEKYLDEIKELTKQNLKLKQSGEQLNERLKAILEIENLPNETKKQIEEVVKLSNEEKNKRKEIELTREKIKKVELAEERKNIDDAIKEIIDSMKTVKVDSNIFFFAALFSMGTGFAIIFSILDILGKVGNQADKIKDVVGYMSHIFPMVLLMIMALSLFRFANQMFTHKSKLLTEKAYIEKATGVLKSVNRMSEYLNSTENVKKIFDKVIEQLIKKDPLKEDKEDKKDSEDNEIIRKILELANKKE